MLNLESASLMKKEIPNTDCPAIALVDSCGLMIIFILPDDPPPKNGKLPGPSPDLHDERCRRETPTL